MTSQIEKLTVLYKEKGDILNVICNLNKALSEARTKLAEVSLKISKLETDD